MNDKPAPDPMDFFTAQLKFLKTKPKPDYKTRWHKTKAKRATDAD